MNVNEDLDLRVYGRRRVGILAEIASLQLEYTYLAKATGKKEYFDRVRIHCCCPG